MVLVKQYGKNNGLAMALNSKYIVLCSDRKGKPVYCTKCGSRMVKNPDCSGDYYPTHIGTVLMSFCPNCGYMKPIVDIEQRPISNRKKKHILQTIIEHKQLIGSHVNQIYHNNLKDVNNYYDFLHITSRVLDIPVDDIKTLTQQQ